MFQQNLVACVKVNGQILRESGDLVTLPFGCEYSILVKNLNSVRAQIGISVDGKDATDGTKLIIAPNSSVELERFIKNGNLQVGNRFKFIERTTEIEGHRGVGSDDGLIRVEAWKELIAQRLPMPRPEYYDDPYPVPVPVPRPYPVYPKHPWREPWGRPILRGSSSGSVNLTMAALGGPPRGSRPMHPTSKGSTAPIRPQHIGSNQQKDQRRQGPPPRPDLQAKLLRSDVGITVPGGESRQQFYSASGFSVEPQSIVIVLRLKGDIGGEPVVMPVTVKTKPVCETCGRSNKSDAQYCSKCGAALVLYA